MPIASHASHSRSSCATALREAKRLSKRVCAACGDAIRPKADFGLTHHQCACRLGVYYCGRECQRAHRPEHREACRAAMGLTSGI